MWIKAANGSIFEVDEQTADALIASATECEAFDADPRVTVNSGRARKTEQD